MQQFVASLQGHVYYSTIVLQLEVQAPRFEPSTAAIKELTLPLCCLLLLSIESLSVMDPAFTTQSICEKMLATNALSLIYNAIEKTHQNDYGS